MTSSSERTSPLISREDAVLVVIDVQERLVSHVDGEGEIIANLAKLGQFAGIIGLPVIVTEQEKLGPTVPEVAWHLKGAQPIAKSHFGCFGCEEFVQALSALGRSTLVLTGIEAHICVAQTALQALDRYTVHVVSDAVGSRKPADRQAALDRMRQAGAIITSTEMLMYELLGRAGTDEFRRVLELVKQE